MAPRYSIRIDLGRAKYVLRPTTIYRKSFLVVIIVADANGRYYIIIYLIYFNWCEQM